VPHPAIEPSAQSSLFGTMSPLCEFWRLAIASTTAREDGSDTTTSKKSVIPFARKRHQRVDQRRINCSRLIEDNSY
jgi:hypothetical protein